MVYIVQWRQRAVLSLEIFSVKWKMSYIEAIHKSEDLETMCRMERDGKLRCHDSRIYFVYCIVSIMHNEEEYTEFDCVRRQE